jgi:hypothetical protein
MNFNFKSEISDGKIDVNNLSNHPTLIHPTLSLPRLKIREAEYYFKMLCKHKINQVLFTFHFDALVNALRSATFVLQKCCSDKEGFEEWYANAQDMMKKDEKLKNIIELRNESQKEGINFSDFGICMLYKKFNDGKIEQKVVLPDREFKSGNVKELIPLFDYAIKKIEEVIEEAHEKGFVDIPDEKQAPIDLIVKKQDADGEWHLCNIEDL